MKFDLVEAVGKDLGGDRSLKTFMKRESLILRRCQAQARFHLTPLNSQWETYAFSAAFLDVHGAAKETLLIADLVIIKKEELVIKGGKGEVRKVRAT